MMDGYDKVQQGTTDLVRLFEAGDLETQNALDGFAKAFAKVYNSDDQFAAEGAYIDAIDALANRCAAVGSSALQ